MEKNNSIKVVDMIEGYSYSLQGRFMGKLIRKTNKGPCYSRHQEPYYSLCFNRLGIIIERMADWDQLFEIDFIEEHRVEHNVF